MNTESKGGWQVLTNLFNHSSHQRLTLSEINGRWSPPFNYVQLWPSLFKRQISCEEETENTALACPHCWLSTWPPKKLSSFITSRVKSSGYIIMRYWKHKEECKIFKKHSTLRQVLQIVKSWAISNLEILRFSRHPCMTSMCLEL